jgi:hypothetical protein
MCAFVVREGAQCLLIDQRRVSTDHAPFSLGFSLATQLLLGEFTPQGTFADEFVLNRVP